MAVKYTKLSGVLKRLLFDNGMRPIDLSRQLKIPQPTIHRLVTGKSTRPYTTSLKPIADYFLISVDQLIGEVPLNDDISPGNAGSQFGIKSVPLLPWNGLAENQVDLHLVRDRVFVNRKIGEKAFATLMPDSSMEPMFPANCVLIFDPDLPVKDRGFALVKLHNSHLCVFRQLIVDLDQRYLKSSNADLNSFKMRSLEPTDQILGCLVESRIHHVLLSTE